MKSRHEFLVKKKFNLNFENLPNHLKCSQIWTFYGFGHFFYFHRNPNKKKEIRVKNEHYKILAPTMLIWDTHEYIVWSGNTLYIQQTAINRALVWNSLYKRPLLTVCTFVFLNEDSFNKFRMKSQYILGMSILDGNAVSFLYVPFNQFASGNAMWWQYILRNCFFLNLLAIQNLRYMFIVICCNECYYVSNWYMKRNIWIRI